MNKRIIFFVFIALLIASGILYVLQLSRSSGRVSLFFPHVTTPTPVETPINQVRSALRLVHIDPQDNQDNVALDQKIQATFDKAANSIAFAIYPDIPFVISSQDTHVSITFSQPLVSDTVYSYNFLDSEGKIIISGTFATGTKADSVAPLSQEYDHLDSTADQAQQESYPDVFLATYVPYETNSFSVTSVFSSSGEGHFSFTVSQKNSGGKKDFLSWLSSLGLTDGEIQKLDIQYK